MSEDGNGTFQGDSGSGVEAGAGDRLLRGVAGPRFVLRFGAICDPIASQLEAQGLTIPPHESVLLQRLADAVTLLGIHGIIPDAEKERAHRRLMKQIGRAARPATVPLPSQDPVADGEGET